MYLNFLMWDECGRLLIRYRTSCLGCLGPSLIRSIETFVLHYLLISEGKVLGLLSSYLPYLTVAWRAVDVIFPFALAAHVDCKGVCSLKRASFPTRGERVEVAPHGSACGGSRYGAAQVILTLARGQLFKRRSMLVRGRRCNFCV